MSHTFHELFVHCVWSTWDRLPLITAEIEPRLYGAIRQKCQLLQCEALAVGGVADHVHVVVRIVPSLTVARLVGDLKGGSSHLVNHLIGPEAIFK